ncbi:MAG: hypothetical protein J6Y92_09660 [Lentisphaeria bacterium]|nr:hypothetical protein [Lentisphaeria bacterium]
MKALIAVVMFLFGVFVGVLVVPMFKEFSTPFYAEEEYSTPRIKTLLNEFGIILPLEANDVNLFLSRNGETKRLWVKFDCPTEAKEDFINKLNSTHHGLFNRIIETPKMIDGTPIIWWTYSNSFQYIEFRDMCVAYDELLHNLYIYAVSGDSEPKASVEREED